MTKSGQDPASVQRPDDGSEPFGAVLEEVRDALRGLRFGQVTIVVQDGVVVQIDRVERRRLQRRGHGGEKT